MGALCRILPIEGQEVRESSSSRPVKTADSAAGLSTGSLLDAGPATQPWSINGTVPATLRSQTKLSGGSSEKPVLLLRLRPRRRCDSGFAELYHQVKFPQALSLLRQWRGLVPLLRKKPRVSTTCSYTVTLRMIPTCISAESVSGGGRAYADWLCARRLFASLADAARLLPCVSSANSVWLPPMATTLTCIA